MDPQTPAPAPENNLVNPKRRINPKVLYIITTLLIATLVGVAVWFIQQSKINKLESKTKLIDSVIEELGGDSSLFDDVGKTFEEIQTKARNTERQTDIKALHGQIEAYYAQNGKYPALANMNDASWRSANVNGLDVVALKDPQGSNAKLVSQPAEKAYSYDVSSEDGSSCDNAGKDCVRYTLTAALEGGGIYTKQNLN